MGRLFAWPFLLLEGAAFLLGGCSGGSPSHSLRYFHLAVLEPGQELPHFVAVGYVDDQLFASYNSDTKEYRPRMPWMERALGPDYWDGQSQIGKGNEELYRVDLVTLKHRYNQSKGLHTLQYMAGCELGPDGHKGGFSQFGYDGRDFLSLDKETLTWTAADPEAQVTKRKLDADATLTQGRKYYLEEVCPEWLQRFLHFGNETLLRREPPVVKVTRKADYDGMETLLCRAHGFYPKEIDAYWMKDGEVWQEGTFRGVVAPNHDGTYHAWVSIKVVPEDRDRFRCRVEHDGLTEPLILAWEEPANVWLIVGAILGIMAAILLASGIIFIIHRKRRKKAAHKMRDATLFEALRTYTA